MKYIHKGEEPEMFAVWKRLQNEDWTPNWDALRSPEKPVLNDALLREQGYICCYCGMEISKENSHIEHFKPRSIYPHLELEYTNLLVSCQRKRTSPEHCGYKKDDWYDEQLMVSPLEANCADFFSYTESGKIQATDDPNKQAAAATTIAQLGLNIDKLIALRQVAIEEILEGIDELTKEEIQKLIEDYEKPDGDGKYSPFCAAIIYKLNQYI